MTVFYFKTASAVFQGFNCIIKVIGHIKIRLVNRQTYIIYFEFCLVKFALLFLGNSPPMSFIRARTALSGISQQ